MAGDLISVVASGTAYRHDGVTSSIKDSLYVGFSSVGGATIVNGNLVVCRYSGSPHVTMYDGFSNSVLDSFDVAGDTSWRGLTSDENGNLIISGTNSDTIYVLDGVSNTITDSFASKGDLTQGLAYANPDLISSTSFSLDKIWHHDGVTTNLITSFAAPSAVPTGLTYDKSTGNLISTDLASNLIYIHDGISVTVGSSFATPASSVQGLAYLEEGAVFIPTIMIM